MAKKWFLHRGLATKMDESFGNKSKLIDLERLIRDVLKKFGVLFSDPCCPESSLQSLVGPGAINVTVPLTQISTEAADAFTLADGKEGQLKTIVMIADLGNGVVTPANASGFTTITFSAVGQSATLMFTNGAWVVISLNGAVAA